MDLFGIVGKSEIKSSSNNNTQYLEVILYTPTIKVTHPDNTLKDAAVRVTFFDRIERLSDLLKAGSRVSIQVSELRANPYISNNNGGPAIGFNAVGLGFLYLPASSQKNNNNNNSGNNNQGYQQPTQQPVYQQPQPQQTMYQQQTQQQQTQQQPPVYQQPSYQQPQQQTQQPVYQQPQFQGQMKNGDAPEDKIAAFLNKMNPVNNNN